MAEILGKIGGRKFFILLIALVLVALKDVIGLDDETINKIVVLAIGGSGTIALEDGLTGLLNGKKTKK